jgi:hypothetical protein
MHRRSRPLAYGNTAYCARQPISRASLRVNSAGKGRIVAQACMATPVSACVKPICVALENRKDAHPSLGWSMKCSLNAVVKQPGLEAGFFAANDVPSLHCVLHDKIMHVN